MRISTREMVWAAMFTALLCVFTMLLRMVQPIIIIPFSLQPLVMLLAACLLSPVAAFLSMFAYLALGLMGLPVFSVPPYGGPAYVLIPSFGFLLAFPMAAWLQSRLIRKNNLLNFILAGIAGVIVLYLLGLPYMYLILKFYLGHTVDVIQLIQIGLIPFIAFDFLKIIIASFIAVQLSRKLDLKREI